MRATFAELIFAFIGIGLHLPMLAANSGNGGGSSYSPSLDFSDARNSQYAPIA